jgi:hypothetical protein
MRKVIIVFVFLFSFIFGEILSLSAREKRSMKKDYVILDNAFSNGYTENFIEFGEKFLERYKLACVDKDANYRNIYTAVKSAIIHFDAGNGDILTPLTENVVEDKELQTLFSRVLLSTAEEIIAFANKYPNFRTNDVYGALERARVTDLEVILATIAKNSIPVNEIIRFSQLYADSISIARIKTDAEKMVIRNVSLLRDYRRVFGITDFDESIEKVLYNRIMYDTDYKNLVTYIEFFPDGKYVKFINELVNSYR